ncbi:MAG: hypothetical protein GWP06_00230 [Actinobacteria bacterium]|nr:hypothetical protein [Actinomycetota bacterium]
MTNLNGIEEKVFYNNDEKLGCSGEFTMKSMIEMYRENSWDEYEGENGTICEMTDQEIVNHVLSLDVEEVND